MSYKDLIPIASWVMLKGRCRYCKSPISLRYPLAELAYAAWGALALWRWGLSAAGIGSMFSGWLMMLNALTDLDTGYVYDHLAGALAVAGAVMRLFGGLSPFLDGLYGAVAGALCIAVIIVASRGGMGWGDATLMAGAGAVLGWKMALLGIYIGFMVGGVVAIGLVAAKKKKRKDALPLAPFLAAGVMTALLFGPEILKAVHQTSSWPWTL